MKTISISDLKTHLSAEIKALTAEGSMLVCDHGSPVAVLSKYEKKSDLSLLPPQKDFDMETYKKLTGRINLLRNAPSALDLLMEDRAKR